MRTLALLAALLGCPLALPAHAAVVCHAQNLAEAAQCNAKHAKAKRNWQAQMEGRDLPREAGQPLDMALPPPVEVFTQLLGTPPAYVSFDDPGYSESRVALFALDKPDRFALVLPYSISLREKDGQGLLPYITFLPETPQMLVFIIALPDGRWPEQGKPQVLAYTSIPSDTGCALGGLPATGGNPMPERLTVQRFAALPDRVFLNLETGWMEGYAGGGGRFVEQRLIELEKPALLSAPIRYREPQYTVGGETALYDRACAPAWYSQSLAGSWNKDGTRQHHEYYGEWRWEVVPSKNKGWSPKLQLLDLTASSRKKAVVARWSTSSLRDPFELIDKRLEQNPINGFD
ncbi:hypothetical protein [Chitinilyticum piscinae]|uniref:Uncharacterized protein n=1 Tax=Chitinilyticum piscinae TaxID=2866724 RepID=A0A8J7FIE3_9NEIS|nr:hypothetical protein [Chitinilyticum piscinae]MBE9608372.1 hypothetical protein [Chitinilyticum piscinae]